MLLFILAFKAGTLKWLFLSIFIISYWRSKTDNIESDYSEGRLLTKNIWPSRKVINKMLKSFKGRYKSTRVIIDCTEVRYQMQSSLQLN